MKMKTENGIERKRQEWLKTLSSDKGTDDYNKKHQIVIGEARQKFLGDMERFKKEGKGVVRIGGFFGPEDPNCDAYLEEIIRPEGGGLLLKAYGCPFLYKGNATQNTVQALQLPKFIFSELTRSVIFKSVVLSSALLFLFLFARKKLVYYVDTFVEGINWRVLRHYDIPEGDYNVPVREIRRAVTKAIEKEFGINTEDPFYRDLNLPKWKRRWVFPTPDDIRGKREQLGWLIARIAKLGGLVLETDNTYRSRTQDALGVGLKNLNEILDILISRETRMGVAHKWKFIKTFANVVLFLSPSLKRFVKYFLEELDSEKVRMDEDDWYFCLKYHSYDFDGLPRDERIKIWERMNRENHVVFMV